MYTTCHLFTSQQLPYGFLVITTIFIHWLSCEQVYMVVHGNQPAHVQIPFMTIQYPSSTRPHNTDKDCLGLFNTKWLNYPLWIMTSPLCSRDAPIQILAIYR